jgi:hypothetical protein
MYGFNLSILLDLWCLAAAAFAVWKGGPAERLAAVVIILNIAVSDTGAALSPDNISLIRLVDDGLTALIMLAITVRFSALWMGGMMLFFAAQFSLHSFYLVTERPPHDNLHAWINNIDFNATVWCLIIGTAVAWRRRVRLAKVAAA